MERQRDAAVDTNAIKARDESFQSEDSLTQARAYFDVARDI